MTVGISTPSKRQVTIDLASLGHNKTFLLKTTVIDMSHVTRRCRGVLFTFGDTSSLLFNTCMFVENYIMLTLCFCLDVFPYIKNIRVTNVVCFFLPAAISIQCSPKSDLLATLSAIL